MTREDRLVAAGPSVGPDWWLGVLDELMTRIGSHFSRVEPRRRAWAFVLGLLAALPRKNCWTIAEHAADPRTPAGAAHTVRADHLAARPASSPSLPEESPAGLSIGRTAFVSRANH